MDNHTLKKQIMETTLALAEEICAFGDRILSMPELGYKEFHTMAFTESKLAALHLQPLHYAQTGLKVILDSGNNGPCVGIIGELDAVTCFGHPNAASLTGAAHACGHNAQMAAAYGALLILLKANVLPHLNGRIALIAAPSEEFLDIEYRQELYGQGKISYLGGKQQMIAEGAFDDVDMAMMLHAEPNSPSPALHLDGGSLGFAAKTIDFYGKAAHGSKPYEGINALNAAMLGLMGIHANREIFRDEDHVRIHPIITNGGTVVNSVPDHVRIETYVRGATADAISVACNAVERAIHGAAVTVGAHAEIETLPGYLPLHQDPLFGQVMEKNAGMLWGVDAIHRGSDTTGSSDIGDLSHIMPCIQPTYGGFIGNLHSREFAIYDKQTAYVDAACLLALTAVDLLANQAAAAQQILAQYRPKFTKEAYLAFLQSQRQKSSY